MERYMMLLKSFKRMPLELEQILRDNVQPLAVRKHDIIQPIGTLSDYLYFVEKGLFHLFLEKDGKQVTLRFKREDEFIICLKEVFSNAKVHGDGIEALEDGLLWLFPGSLVSDLQDKYHQFGIQYGTILAKDWISIEESGRCSRQTEGSNNYDLLCATSPELLDRVPIQYLANYTNIPEKVFRHLHSTKIKLNVLTTRRRRR
jgi:signal-transduction protein with cAMP-binding, CBS, and nucleotidyltransferase domain